MPTSRPIAALTAAGLLLAGAACSTLPGGGASPAAASSPARHRCVPAAPDPARPDDPVLADVMRMIVSSAENSTLDWERQYGYIEYDVEGVPGENRGYTGGIVGFTSKTHDMLVLVRSYAQRRPDAPLARYVPALERVDGSASREGLGEGFVAAWRQAGDDPEFQRAQRDLADEMYVRPALRQARKDGLRALGRFAYVDAIVVHGPGTGERDFGGIRAAALRTARTPARGGDERAWIEAFLDARTDAMRAEESHSDTSRIDDAQRRWLREGNLDLRLPLEWSVYGDAYRIDPPGACG